MKRQFVVCTRSIPYPSCAAACVLVCALVAWMPGCSSQVPETPRTSHESTSPGNTADQAAVAAGKPRFARLTSQDVASLPNAIQVHQKIISGGTPDGEAGFAALQRLGVRTIISVDGAAPDVAAAERFGLRYVHFPLGYDGISPARAKELAKAVRDLPGPIYIHCHHGKHRSPTAAAVACVGAGLIAAEHAPEILKLAGTSEQYRGLHACAAASVRFTDAELDALAVDYVASADVPPMIDAMVEIDRLHEALRDAAARGWQGQSSSPAQDPAHLALLLREQFAVLLRLDLALDRGPQMRQLLEESERQAAKLHDVLLAGWPSSHSAADMALRALTEQCRACHARFRENPAP